MARRPAFTSALGLALGAWGVLAAAGLSGCLDDHARPLHAFLNDPAYLEAMADAGAAADAEAEDAGPRCSPLQDGEPRTITFHSAAQSPLGLFYVQPDCVDRFIADLPPGQFVPANAALGQVWHVKLQGTLVVDEVVITDATPATLEVGVGQ